MKSMLICPAQITPEPSQPPIVAQSRNRAVFPWLLSVALATGKVGSQPGADQPDGAARSEAFRAEHPTGDREPACLEHDVRWDAV